FRENFPFSPVKPLRRQENAKKSRCDLTARRIALISPFRIKKEETMGFQQVILTEPVDNLGAEADIVKVRRGYARNFLIPRGKALEVTPGTLRRINFLKARRAEREAQELTNAEELGSKIRKLKLTFT